MLLGKAVEDATGAAAPSTCGISFEQRGQLLKQTARGDNFFVPCGPKLIERSRHLIEWGGLLGALALSMATDLAWYGTPMSSLPTRMPPLPPP